MSEPITRNEHNVYPSYPREPVSKSTGGDDIRADNQSTVFKIVNMVKDNSALFIGVLLTVNIILGMLLFFAWRDTKVASDLQGFDARQAQVRLEVDEQLLTVLNCRRGVK